MQENTQHILSLMIIIVVATIALCVTYVFTKDTIEENKKQEFFASVHLAFPDSDRTTLQPVYKKGNLIGEYYTVYDKLNQVIGYIVVEEVNGYQSTIKLMIGFDKQKELHSVIILEQYETAGIGTQIVEKQWFTEQFRGKNIDQVVLTGKGGDIDSITGATVSSKAVIKGVRESFEIMQQNK